MKVYLFIGTHLPEIRTAIASMVEAAGTGCPSEVIWPEGLNPPQNLPVSLYDPSSTAWNFDPGREVNVFLLIDPRAGLLDQVKQLAGDMRSAGLEPAGILTCVDSASAEADPHLREWLEAAVYFSDAVLMGNRKEASKPFLRDFEKSYSRRCYPCRFMLLKGPGRPDSPHELLAPDNRRLSQAFDLPEELETELPGLIIEASCDLDADARDDQEDDLATDPIAGEALENIPDIRHLVVP